MMNNLIGFIIMKWKFGMLWTINYYRGSAIHFIFCCSKGAWQAPHMTYECVPWTHTMQYICMQCSMIDVCIYRFLVQYTTSASAHLDITGHEVLDCRLSTEISPMNQCFTLHLFWETNIKHMGWISVLHNGMLLLIHALISVVGCGMNEWLHPT